MSWLNKDLLGEILKECACQDENPHSYMAKPQLAKVAEYAQKLHDLVPDNQPLEDWMESKIAQIADDISEVYHRLSYDHNGMHEELDPVGKEDGDIDNDGDVDSTDSYLKNRREKIGDEMSKKKV